MVKYQRFFTSSFSCSHGAQSKVVLDLSDKVKVSSAIEKDKLTVKQTVEKFNVGKFEVYDITKGKSGIKKGGLKIVMVE